MDANEIKKAVHQADQNGLAVMIHAVGDRANRELVSLFGELESARSRDGKAMPAHSSLPHRIEHVQMIRPEDLVRLGRLNVVASIVPTNMTLDINMIDESVGPKGRWTYSFRDMLNAGVQVLFSSDCPVCDPNPLVGIHAAVTRRRKDGTPPEGWYSSQRITVEEAVRGYTIDPAIAYGMENKLGSITQGKWADIIILDRDIFAKNPMEIADAKVYMTVFYGLIVFRR